MTFKSVSWHQTNLENMHSPKLHEQKLLLKLRNGMKTLEERKCVSINYLIVFFKKERVYNSLSYDRVYLEQVKKKKVFEKTSQIMLMLL